MDLPSTLMPPSRPLARHRPPQRISRLRLPALLLALGAALSFEAAAADPPATDADSKAKEQKQDTVTLDPVSVSGRREDNYSVRSTSSATKLDLSPRETPQSVTIITRQRMDDQDLWSVRQVLDNIAGIYSNAYDSERVLFYSRGFLVDSLMYDGVPAISSFNTGSIDETLDTAPYQRIEVVRGATGLMTGTGSPAASINLIRKHAESRSPVVTFDLSAGSWQQARAVVDASAPLNDAGSVRARFVGVASDTESYQNLYHKKTYVLYGIVDADLGPKTRLSVGYDYQDNQPRSNTWGSFPLFLSNGQLADWPRSVTTATDWSFWNRKTQTAFAELSHTFDNGWIARGTLSRRQYEENLALFYVYGFPDPVTGEGLEPYAYAGDGKITETSLDVYATGPFELFGRRHSLVVGANGSRAKNIGNAADPEYPLPPTGNFFEWNGSYPRPTFLPSYQIADIKTDQDAVYAAARFSVADPLHVIVGGRYARWKVDSIYAYDTPVNSNYDFSRFIPYAGIVWDFSRQFSAYASYTGTFKPQNARDITGHYLDPVDGNSYEIGIKGEHMDGLLTTSLTLFDTEQNNVAAPVLDPETGQPILLPDGSSVSIGVDGIRTRGFEVDLAGRITNNIQATLGWTYYRMTDRSGQSFRTFIPNQLVRAFATWQPREYVPNLTLGAGVNWQSATSTIVGSPDGPTNFQQDAVTLVSLMARYQFTPRASLQFNANNVFDRKYFVLDQYDNSYYGPPVNFAVSFRMTFD